jgi:steroid 5-alpha reductase family enzyme
MQPTSNERDQTINVKEEQMTFDTPFFISIAAIAIMFYCLYLVLTLRQNVPGGIVGSKWNFLMTLVAFFTVGYLATPFFAIIPEGILRLIVSGIFFFGAIYVVITVKLIYRIIKELTE